MLPRLLPQDPAERRLALRFAIVLGGLALVLLTVVLATKSHWPEAMAAAEKAGKKVKLEHLVKVWVWRGLVIDTVLAVLLAVTVRWWVGGAKTDLPASVTAPSRRFWIIAGLILLCAAGVRLPRLGLSFYNDEAHNFVRMTSGELKHSSAESDAFTWNSASWVETLWFNKPGNNSQPHSLLSRLSYDAWKGVTDGADGEVCEWAVRLPTLFAGLGSLLLLGLAMRELAGSVAGGVTMIAGALHAWHVRYSTEARGYGLMILGIAVMIFFLHRAMRMGRWRDWFGYGAGNFLALWAFPGCLYWVAALNGCLILQLLWKWNFHKESLESLVRLIIAGTLALMLALPLMLPLFPQLVEAIQNVPGLRGTMTVAWWQDVGGYLLYGCRWNDADQANPSSLAMARFLRDDANWWLPALNALLMALIGWWGMVKSQGALRLLALAGLLAVLLGWADMARQGRYLNHWYLLYSLPVVLLCLGHGVAALLAQVRLLGWQRLVGAVLLALVATRMTSAVTEQCLTRSKGEERRGIEQVRGAIYPHYTAREEAKAPIVGAIWSNAPIYDPLAVVIKSPQVFETLKLRSTREQRPLYVIMGHRQSAFTEQPEVVRQLESPEFETVAVYPGLDEEQYTQTLFRMRK